MRFGSQFEISLNTLDSNFQKVKSICKSNEVIFMVKADAYGHGLVPITRFSFNELGIREFGCASLGEGTTLRKELPKDFFEIYIFSDLGLSDPELREFYSALRLTPIISNERDLSIFLEDENFKNIPLCLKFNTGMNRLGLEISRMDEIIKTLKIAGRKSIDHLMTHLACASLSIENKKNAQQFERFEQIKTTLKSSGIKVDKTSISNSGAIEQGAGLKESHVRPGLMMYGPSSLIPAISSQSKYDGELISSLKTKIISINSIKKGTPIGYGANVCPASGNVYIAALGYGDGFSTFNQGVEIEYMENTFKVVGRVNMDMAHLLLEDENTCQLKENDSFVIWSRETDNFKRICERSKMIPYEVLTSVTSRVPKIYVD